MEGKNYYGAMDLRRNLEAGKSEGGTGKEAHGKPGRTQDADTMVPSGLEGAQEMQGEESRGLYRVISGELLVERGMEKNSEVVLRSQGSPSSPHH